VEYRILTLAFSPKETSKAPETTTAAGNDFSREEKGDFLHFGKVTLPLSLSPGK